MFIQKYKSQFSLLMERSLPLYQHYYSWVNNIMLYFIILVFWIFMYSCSLNFFLVQAIHQLNGSANLDHGDMKIPLEIGILKQFPFSSNAQCMSVITRTLGSRQMTLYTKGAPEKILQMCNPDSSEFFISNFLFISSLVIAIFYY